MNEARLPSIALELCRCCKKEFWMFRAPPKLKRFELWGCGFWLCKFRIDDLNGIPEFCD
jgi:hypothetical protein